MARANRVLAETLPNVVLSAKPEPAKRRDLARYDAVPVSKAPPARAQQRREDTPRRERAPLSMAKPERCHARPTDTKGNGGSRKFAGRYCK